MLKEDQLQLIVKNGFVFCFFIILQLVEVFVLLMIKT